MPTYSIHKSKEQILRDRRKRKENRWGFRGTRKTQRKQQYFNTPLAIILSFLLVLAQSASIIGGLNIALGNNLDVGLSQVTQAAELDGYQQRFRQTTRGEIVFSGNALGLNTFQNIPDNPINGSIDTFTTTDATLQTPGFPSGTTTDWTQNSSMAVVDIPDDALILYAELIWGANYRNISNTLNIEAQIDTPVTLNTPTGPNTITPDPATASETDYGYIRTAEVTELIAPGGGQFTVGGVPAIIDPLDKSGNYAGWTLAVVYSQADLPIRNLTFYTGSESVFTNRQDGNTVEVTGFGTPLQGDFEGKLWISTQEGDSDLVGDQFLFGETEGTMSPISGPNNLADNFFAAQINGADGTVDTRGTFGVRNQDLGTSAGGRRHGFDITAVDITDRMQNGQTQAFIKGTSSGDIYVINGLGVQIDVNAPNPLVTIERDKEFVRVGETIRYDISVTNDGIIDGQNPNLNSLIPEGTDLVPGTFTIDGVPTDLDPAVPIDIDDIAPGETQTYSYEVRVNTLPPSNVFENEAFVEYSYTPIAGADVVTEQTFSSKVVTFGLAPVGLPPVAENDAETTQPDTPVTLDVVANDSDPDGNLSIPSIFITTPPTNGTATVDTTTGQSTYTPNPGFTGEDTYVYNICDTEGLCDDATVTITIRELTPPIAEDDSATTRQGEPVNIPILTNDTDPINDPITADQLTVTTPPAFGTVTIDPTTLEAVYTPSDPAYIGPDQFIYELCNEDGCDPATVDITMSERIIPDAVDDTATTKENTPVDLPLLDNDTPGNGAAFDTSTLAVVDTAQPQNGTVTIDQTSGVATYTPNQGFLGDDTFQYTICNDQSECDTATATITVEAILPPDAVDDSAVTDEQTPVVIPVLDNDTPGDGPLDPSTTTILDNPANGTVVVDDTTGEITYTPNPGFTGEDTFVYEICDDNAKCDSANVSVLVDPVLPPTANPDTINTLKNEPVEVPILDNDVDPLDGLTNDDFQSITTPPANGTAEFDPVTGRVLYTPNTDYVGSDTFNYEICNADGCSETTVSVNIAAPEAPDAVDDVADTLANVPVNVPVLSNDTPGTDRVLDPTTLQVTTPPTNGTAVIDTTTNDIIYTPSPDFTGSDQLSYEICNDANECDIANVLITVSEPPRPDAVEDSAVTPQDTPILIPILNNDDLPEGTDPANVTFLLDPENGTITYDPVNGVTYTPNPGFTGEDRFVYKICTPFDTCDSAEVKVTVTPINQAPANPAPTNPPRRGQVLGASEVVDQGNLPRTGGAEEFAANLMIAIGLLASMGFFTSLYFAKSKNN
jgi:uncharacterized repeat protein (TIGR01451 family)